MKTTDLIAVNGGLYSYFGFDEQLKMHKVAEVDIDDEGLLTATYITAYFTEEEMKNDELHLTQMQWIGIVQHLLRSEFELDEEKVVDAAPDIVCRCFVYGIPKLKDLPAFLEEYLNR